MFDDAPRARAAEGAPPWVMTFADLMSLLMCFFVLLLSFSEMDVSKYKEMAGSMKDAFGVQRDIKSKEPPKGINVIAREFSPGRPEPTELNVIRQMTTRDLRVNLDLGKRRHRPAPTPRAKRDPGVEKTPGAQSQAAGLTAVQQQELAQAKALAAKRLEEKLKAEAQLADKQAKDKANRITIDQTSLDELVAARIAAQKQRKLEQSAKLISNALGQEIRSGSVDVETAGQKIIIRVREKASFGSGRAALKEDFRPILARVAEILRGTDGKIIVAGHTDNVPIYTERFRSNWELSAARAVSVAHEMMLATNIPAERFLIQGFADTEPVAKNDTPANRAKNRRVEIVLQQGDDKQSGDQISGKKSPSPGGRPLLPAAPAQGHTAVKPDKPGSTLGIRAGGH
ncbi:MAG: type VI secretion system protein TssL, long form [Thiogranum sp.]|nr:type VI secretion system protein TssL, long form [Thiogranum sp.]